MPHLLVTRPRPQGDAWVERLRAAGWHADALPLIDIAPAADAQPVREAARSLPGFALVVFVSPNAVTHFFQAAGAAAWPAQVLAGSPGPGTTEALRAAGLPADAIVEPAADAAQFDSEALWQQLARRRDWRGTRVLIVRGEGGRDWLSRTLGTHGADVRFLQAYRRRPPRWSAAERGLAEQAARRPREHVWLFSSSESIDHLRTLMPGAGWGSARAVVTHPRIAERARDAGFGEVIELRPGLPSLLEALPGLA